MEKWLWIKKTLHTTKPKRNADFRAKSKGLCIFMKSLIPIAIGNGFSSGQEKIKLNKKLLLRAQTETKGFLACPYYHCRNVVINSSKNQKERCASL